MAVRDRKLESSLSGDIRYRMKVTQRQLLKLAGRKQCSRCCTVFVIGSSHGGSKCLSCEKERSAKKYQRSREAISEKSKLLRKESPSYRYKRFVNSCRQRGFPLTSSLEVYSEVIKIKECQSCGKTEEENGKQLAVDHCHKTGRIRGVLCSGCNKAEGFAGGIDGLKKLIKYLEQSK